MCIFPEVHPPSEKDFSFIYLACGSLRTAPEVYRVFLRIQMFLVRIHIPHGDIIYNMHNAVQKTNSDFDIICILYKIVIENLHSFVYNVLIAAAMLHQIVWRPTPSRKEFDYHVLRK